MTTDIVMPQMGESVAEGTIVRWLKQVGDAVVRDEPLFEISTDKVDAEIPSPAAGVVLEIRYAAGTTVEINTVVAVVGLAWTQPASEPSQHAAPELAPPSFATPDASTAAPAVAAPPIPAFTVPSLEHQPITASAPSTGGPGARVTPVARNIAAAHGIDPSHLTGTGGGGRVMKADVLAALGGAPPTAAPPVSVAFAPPPPKSAGVSAGAGLAGQTVPMSVMRRKIAAHMVESKRTSAHVHSVIEISFAQVERVRQAQKAEYERQGARVTYLSFILKAAADALKAVPVINASLDGDRVVYHPHVNIGIAVALDWGLIVPVIRDADRKSLAEISAALADLASRARQKKLKPEEVGGGTFTVTNPGGFGSIIGFPIINQPQVAILCVGVIEKRVVVVNDAFAIRHMAYISLGFDHRIVDGAVADEFLGHIKHALENWPAS